MLSVRIDKGIVVTDLSIKAPALGKLKHLGPDSLAQAPLLLPLGWDDFRFPLTDLCQAARSPEGTQVIVCGVIQTEPSVARGKPPRTTITLADSNGATIRSTFFGDARPLKLAAGKRIAISGVVKFFNDQVWLNNPEVVEDEWVGRLRPKYPGKPKIIKPDTVRKNITNLLPTYTSQAADYLATHIERLIPVSTLMEEMGLPSVTLEKVIRVAHVPKTISAGQRAQDALGTMATFCRLGEVAQLQQPRRKWLLPVNSAIASEVARALPFTLDSGQQSAVEDILSRLGGRSSIRHIISGDVGSGKTAVFACIAAAVAHVGGRVAILAPMGVLARQSLDVIRSSWPNILCELVIGEPKSKLTEDKRTNVHSAQIVAGSTALLFQDVGSFDLIIVDEQQRFSRDQREALIRCGDEHLIEVTATCIPRSMALLKYGQWSFSRLRGDYVKKNITTEIVCAHKHKQARELIMRRIKETLAVNRQVLIIYPRREEPAGAKGAPRSVESATPVFERLFPGNVLSLDGKRTADEKVHVIEQMKQGRAQILVATSVVEVGLDIPGLQRVVVVNPERMGLSALHQIRGRVARAGGQGYMDLYAPDTLAAHSLARLEELVKTQDGFELTERDMELRGVGSLASDSDQQTGADESLLFGRPITLDMLQSASVLMESLKAAPKTTGI